jgi:hypothetical protein
MAENIYETKKLLIGSFAAFGLSLASASAALTTYDRGSFDAAVGPVTIRRYLAATTNL